MWIKRIKLGGIKIYFSFSAAFQKDYWCFDLIELGFVNDVSKGILNIYFELFSFVTITEIKYKRNVDK